MQPFSFRSLFLLTCLVLFRLAIPVTAQPNAASKASSGLPGGMPDLQGVYTNRWITDLADPNVVEKAVDVPFTPWGRQVWDERQANHQKDDTTLQCLPDGLPRQAGTPYPMQIVQTPTQVVFLYEGAAHTFRVVPTDGRPHGKYDQLWMGDSVGHYEGDTLVIDVINFNDRAWLDGHGHPHSDQLHLIERWRKSDPNTLHYEVTIEDPKAYTKPWTTSFNYRLRPEMQLMEYWCTENEKDTRHMIGK